MGTAPATLIPRISLDDPLLIGHVESAARATDRPARPLHLQALLQLPRVADSRGLVPILAIKGLLAELAEELPDRPAWLVPDAGSSPRLLSFRAIDQIAAHDVMRRFHYLRSPRTDGRAYGLTAASGRLVALCVSSPLDVRRLRDLLGCNARSNEFARVVSRVFVFEGAPRNSISYLLSRVAREERHLGVTDLLTYVNPNMMFSGSSYRASGWRQLGSEPGTTYRYLDGRYITDRELASRYGARGDEGYKYLLGQRFAKSVMPLAPLLVFHTSLLCGGKRGWRRRLPTGGCEFPSRELIRV